MQALVRFIDRLNEKIGHALAWVALVMVLVQFIVVVMRYVFAIGNIAMQESIWYMHGIIFMIGAGYTLLHNGHVRVDVIYGDATPRYKAWVDLLGTIFLLMPVTAATLWLSWDYVINSWKVWEGSTEVSGLPLIWAYKTVIWVLTSRRRRRWNAGTRQPAADAARGRGCEREERGSWKSPTA